MSLRIRPITLRQAQAFVQEHHRHHQAPPGGAFALALMRIEQHDSEDIGQLVGVAIAGRPVSRVLQRRGYLEITRVCVLPDIRNGCSMLYGACRRVGQAMGYERFVTYTLDTENGASARASGFTAVGKVSARSWSCTSRPRTDKSKLATKTRWEYANADA